MRRTIIAWVLGWCVAATALAQAGAYSNRLPDGAAPPDPTAVGGNGSCPCVFGTPEGEADCGTPVDTVNGGCNSAPQVFGTLAPGGSVCGTADVEFTTPGIRDTDWYEVEITEPVTHIFRVEAEFPAQVAVIDPAGGCPPPGAIAQVLTTGCGDVATLSLDLPAGTYWFFVAPQFGPTYACGAEYSASVQADLPVQAIPAVGKLGLAAIAVLLAGLAFFLLRRRHAATT